MENEGFSIRNQAFIWSLVLRRLNANDLYQLHRPFKALSPDICVKCKLNNETAIYICIA